MYRFGPRAVTRRHHPWRRTIRHVFTVACLLYLCMAVTYSLLLVLEAR